MSRRNQTFEIIVGFSVLLCTALFLSFALKSSNMKNINRYDLFARFDNAEGILTGSDVKLSGIKIGSVTDQFINEDYNAVLKVSIDKKIKLPKDSTIKITTSGLVGSKFLDIQPGADVKFLAENDEIRFTQSTINLEDLISRFVFNKDESENEQK